MNKIDINNNDLASLNELDEKAKVVPISKSAGERRPAWYDPEAEPWQRGLHFTKDGYLRKGSRVNARLFLEHDEQLAGVLKFNAFSQDIEISKTIELNGIEITGGHMTDIFVSAVIDYLEEKYRHVFQDKDITESVRNVAYKHSYNPVTEYFDHVHENWDKNTRDETFLHDFLGVEQSETTTLITKLWFIGAVAKAYKPKTKFDWVLDLVGGQGAGKTTLLQRMGLQERQGWYVDDIASFTDKDNYMKMLGHLILNDDEMVATKNATFEEAKSFISQLTLYFRKPYAKAPIEYPKNFVIARTTNDDTYLKDKTGDRRFLPVYVDKNKQKYHPVTDLTDELVDLLWGEFVHYYKQGFSFNLTQEQLEMLEDNREPFKYVDDFEDKLIRYLDTDIPIDFYSAGNKTKHARYFYITEIMEFGESDTHEFLGHETKPRDFVTAPRFLWEVFQENAGKGGTGKNSNKFHNIMKHRKGWQSATRRGTRGYKRK